MGDFLSRPITEKNATDGKNEKIISPRTRPDSQEIVSWITDGQ